MRRVVLLATLLILAGCEVRQALKEAVQSRSQRRREGELDKCRHIAPALYGADVSACLVARYNWEPGTAVSAESLDNRAAEAVERRYERLCLLPVAQRSMDIWREWSDNPDSLVWGLIGDTAFLTRSWGKDSMALARRCADIGLIGMRRVDSLEQRMQRARRMIEQVR